MATKTIEIPLKLITSILVALLLSILILTVLHTRTKRWDWNKHMTEFSSKDSSTNFAYTCPVYGSLHYFNDVSIKTVWKLEDDGYAGLKTFMAFRMAVADHYLLYILMALGLGYLIYKLRQYDYKIVK